jgi:hypothetical protein
VRLPAASGAVPSGSEHRRVADLAGPAIASAPPRHPGSVRRTAHLDVTRVPGVAAAITLAGVRGAARDLVTSADGAHTVGEATLAITLDREGAVATVEQSPPQPSCAEIVGAPLGFAIRSHIKTLLQATTGSLLGLLLDDLSGAAAPTGYAMMRDRKFAGIEEPRPPQASQIDVCAGWRAGGLPARRSQAGEPVPTDEPFEAPPLHGDDGVAWHAMGSLEPSQTRRVRRLDITADRRNLHVDAMFRDVSIDPDRTPRVVHEYLLRAVLDRTTLTVLEIEAEPRALPFPTDCPLAAASATALIGHTVHDLRHTVRALSRRPASCTHLNDLLRSLADVTVLVHHLPAR